jgi:hypothetical protein
MPPRPAPTARSRTSTAGSDSRGSPEPPRHGPRHGRAHRGGVVPIPKGALSPLDPSRSSSSKAQASRSDSQGGLGPPRCRRTRTLSTLRVSIPKGAWSPFYCPNEGHAAGPGGVPIPKGTQSPLDCPMRWFGTYASCGSDSQGSLSPLDFEVSARAIWPWLFRFPRGLGNPLDIEPGLVRASRASVSIPKGARCPLDAGSLARCVAEPPGSNPRGSPMPPRQERQHGWGLRAVAVPIPKEAPRPPRPATPRDQWTARSDSQGGLAPRPSLGRRLGAFTSSFRLPRGLEAPSTPGMAATAN